MAWGWIRARVPGLFAGAPRPSRTRGGRVLRWAADTQDLLHVDRLLEERVGPERPDPLQPPGVDDHRADDDAGGEAGLPYLAQDRLAAAVGERQVEDDAIGLGLQ